MKNYLYMYYSESNTSSMPESAKAAWAAWFEKLGDSVVDSGNPVDPSSKAVLKNGSSTSEKDPVIGYSIVKANSLDEAVKMAEDCPLANAPGTSIGVYETLPM